MPPIWVGFRAPNSLNKRLFFGRFSINKGGLSRNWRKIAKMGGFPPKFIIKVGMRQLSVIRRGHLSENRAADPRPFASHVPPPPPPGHLDPFLLLKTEATFGN